LNQHLSSVNEKTEINPKKKRKAFKDKNNKNKEPSGKTSTNKQPGADQNNGQPNPNAGQGGEGGFGGGGDDAPPHQRQQEDAQEIDGQEEGQNQRREPTEQQLLLEQRARAGDREAQFQLAQNYYFGNEEMGIEPQPERAEEYFEMAADNEHPMAAIDMAIMLLNKRRRTPEQEKKAFEILQKASEKGNTVALNALAYMYERG